MTARRLDSRPLRIGYLVQQFAPEVGAGPARVVEMARRWMAAGAEVTVITGMPNRPQGRIYPEYRGRWFMEEEWEGMRVLRSWLYADPRHGFGRTVLNNLTFMVTSAVHGLWRGGRPDVLIASAPPFFPHLTGALLAATKRVPLVLELRDLWPDYLVGMGVLKPGRPETRLLFGLERRVLGRADRVVVVTESFKTRVIEKGVPAERITVVPNGVDTAFYFPTEEPPPLEALARRNGEVVVGYLGNFGAGQGLEAVVEAAAILATRRAPVRFVLAGDGPARAGLVARVREFQLPNLVVHPPIPKAVTRAFYNACDVCLVPLAPVDVFQETVPSKLFEVMACGRPLVASVGGEAAAIVQRSGGGVVVPPGDAAAIADGIERLRRTPADARAAMGERARDYVDRHFSRAALADRYLEMLVALAGGPGVTGDEPAMAAVA
ncbi:MAG TPA: glycosyltransferase family 4 protein [Gemmatimonadales bacterium]|nr:glycosyltransferase family 4 protein [Gemmatimonadales bacterium]